MTLQWFVGTANMQQGLQRSFLHFRFSLLPCSKYSRSVFSDIRQHNSDFGPRSNPAELSSGEKDHLLLGRTLWSLQQSQISTFFSKAPPAIQRAICTLRGRTCPMESSDAQPQQKGKWASFTFRYLKKSVQNQNHQSLESNKRRIHHAGRFSLEN